MGLLMHRLAVDNQFRESCPAYPPDRLRAHFDAEPGHSHAAKAVRSVSHPAWHPRYKSVRSRAVPSEVPEIYYDLIYALASKYSHGSGDWLREIARAQPGGIHVSYQGDKMEAELVVLMACGTFLQILVVANAALGLGLNDTLHGVQQDFTSFAGLTWESVFCETRTKTP